MTSSAIDVRSYRIRSNQILLKPTDIDALQCPLCGDLLHDPIQVTACGHRFCRSCIEKCMSHRYVLTILPCDFIYVCIFCSEGPYQCPVDNEEFVRAQVSYFCIHIFCGLKFTPPFFVFPLLSCCIGTHRQRLSQRTSESGNRVCNTTHAMQMEGASNTASGTYIASLVTSNCNRQYFI